MPGTEDTGAHASLHSDGQLEQADHVRNQGAGAPDALGQLLLGDTELLQQLLIGGRFLKRVQLHTVDVLQQRVAQHRIVLRLTDDSRDRLQASLLGRAKAALTHDEFIGSRRSADRTHHDRLHEPEFPDGVN